MLELVIQRSKPSPTPHLSMALSVWFCGTIVRRLAVVDQIGSLPLDITRRTPSLMLIMGTPGLKIKVMVRTPWFAHTPAYPWLDSITFFLGFAAHKYWGPGTKPQNTQDWRGLPFICWSHNCILWCPGILIPSLDLFIMLKEPSLKMALEIWKLKKKQQCVCF